MGKKKKSVLPYDKRGGVIVKRRPMIESKAYESMLPESKVLMELIQLHWKSDKPVAYGIREAQKKIGCGRRKAMAAFAQLQERGFIIKVDESLFNSRTQSKSRTWRVTWMPFSEASPTNDWENWANGN
jgi:hypothetical protein